MSNLASLVVSLEANIARFQADMNRAASVTSATMSGIERAASSAKTALAGVAAGISVAALASMVQDTIAATAALDDLAEKTGATVERLSSLQEVAKIGGHDFNAVGDSIVKLAKSMVQSTDASSGAAKALDAIGLKATDASGALKNSGDFLVELATRLSTFEDGTAKTAVALELLGKSGAQALPFLKDLVDLGEINAKVTAEQAALADEYEKNLKRLGIEQQDMQRTLSLALLPALNEFIKGLLEAANETGGLRDAIRRMAADGTILDWGRSIAIGIAVVIDTFRFLKDVIVAFGSSVGVVLADLQVLWAALKTPFSSDARAELPKIWEERNKKLLAANQAWADLVDKDYRTTETAVRKMQALSDEAKKHEWGFVPQGTQLAYKPAAAAVDEYTKSLEKLLNTLENRGDSVTQEFWQQLAILHKAFNEGRIPQERYAAAVGELVKRTKFGAEALKEYEDAQKDSIAAQIAANKLQEEARAAYYKSGQAAMALVEGLQFEVQTLMMTNAEREIAIKLRELERTGIDKTSEAYEYAASKIRYLVESKDSLQGQIDLWQGVEEAAHDAFVNLLQDGKDAFDRLRDALKNGLMELLYQLTVKPFIINIAAAISGNPGMAGALGGPGGGGGILGGLQGLLSGGSSLLGGLGGSLGGLGGSFALSGIGESLGLSVAMGAGEGLALTGLGTALGAIGAALPYVGAAIAIASAFGLFDDDPSEVQGQFGIRAGGGDLFEDGRSTRSRFGNVGFLDEGTMYFSGEGAQVFNQVIAETLDAIATRLTDTQVESLAARLQATDFGGLEGELTTEEFLQQFGGQILNDVISAAFDELDPALAAIVRGFEGTADEVTELANGLLVFHDVAARLPDTIRNGLTAALDETAETIERLTAIAGAYVTLQEVLNSDPMEDAAEAIRRATQGTFDAFIEQSDALDELIANFDGSAEAATQLANATAEYYQSQVRLLAQLEQLRDSVSNVFADTARNIQLSILDRDGQLDFLADESDAILAQLNATTDPEQIQRLVEQLNQNLNQSFGLLSPEEQQRRAQEYLDYIEQANRAAQERITLLQEEAQQRAVDSETRLRSMLEAHVFKLERTGDKFENGSETLLEAARTFPREVRAIVVAGEVGE